MASRTCARLPGVAPAEIATSRAPCVAGRRGLFATGAETSCVLQARDEGALGSRVLHFGTMYALTGFVLSCMCSCPSAGLADVAQRRAAFAEASRVFAGVVVAIDTIYDLGYTLPLGEHRSPR